MKFENYRFAAGIKKSIAEAGFKKPTDIQFKSIPPILRGEDVLAISQTGTGKTAAFVLPVLNRLLELPVRDNSVRCLVMAPTRELVRQTDKVFKQFGKYTKLSILGIHGGVEQEEQIKRLQAGVDILIATPGRMFDLVSQGYLHLNALQILIVDEADHMLGKGFIKDIRDLIRFLPRKRQTLFFSATIDKEIKKLAYSLVRNPIRIQISPKDPVSKNIKHFVAFVEMDDKRFFLERIIKENPEAKILVFVRTKVRAERVMKAMERVQIKASTIHSDKEQPERLKVFSAFRRGELKVLIATDVSARGVDIPDVEFVINYDMPEQAENYVHRIGRTGRGRSKGNAVSFCSPEERELLTAIEEFPGKKIPELEISKNDYRETIDFSEQEENDWRSVMKDIRADEELAAGIRKKRAGKKKKKK
jgi:ATP-dependent RNA helicase RhlE